MLRFVLLGAYALMLAGCASVARGTTEVVVFESDPSGAEMRSILDYPCGGPCPPRPEVLGSTASYNEDVRTTPIIGPICLTPCSAAVPRSEDLIVTFSKPGYETQTVKLGRELVGGGMASAGNVIIGGGIGLVTDIGTGANMDHKPNPLKVVLVPVRQPATVPLAVRKKR